MNMGSLLPVVIASCLFSWANIKHNMETNYQTDSLATASYLISIGYRLLEVKAGNNTHKIFVFEKTTDLLHRIDLFNSLEARIEPMSYFNSLRYLKSVIHSQNQ